MDGWDIFVSRVLTKREIKQAWELILGVKRESIEVVKSIDEAESHKNTLQVLCQTFLCKDKHFPIRIDIYFHEWRQDYEKIPALERFSSIVKCDVLVGDETFDPFAFWLIKSEGGIEKVSASLLITEERNMEAVDLED